MARDVGFEPTRPFDHRLSRPAPYQARAIPPDFASTPQVFAGIQSSFGLLLNPMLSGLFEFSKKKTMFLLLLF
jgi:hypothetical protein